MMGSWEVGRFFQLDELRLGSVGSSSGGTGYIISWSTRPVWSERCEMIMGLQTKGTCGVALALGKPGGIDQFYMSVLLRSDVSALGWSVAHASLLAFVVSGRDLGMSGKW